MLVLCDLYEKSSFSLSISSFIHLCFHSTLCQLSIVLHHEFILGQLYIVFSKAFSDFLLSKIQANLAGECNFHSQFSYMIFYIPAHIRSVEALLPNKAYSIQTLQDCFVLSIIYYIPAQFNGIAVLHHLSRYQQVLGQNFSSFKKGSLFGSSTL